MVSSLAIRHDWCRQFGTAEQQLESGYLYFGNPVKQIRPLTETEREGLKYSANNYVKWKNEYLDQDNQIQP